MIRIRNRQEEALAHLTHDALAKSILEFAREAMSKTLANWNDAALSSAIHQHLNAASKVGIRTERSKFRFVCLALLRPDDPFYRREELASFLQGEGDPEQRVDDLLDEVLFLEQDRAEAGDRIEW